MIDGAQLAGEALPELFLAHRPALRAFLRARCGQREVDDLLQALWLEVQRAPRGHGDRGLAHLYRLAHQMVVEHGRGASSRDRRGRAISSDVERALIVPRPVTAADTLRELGERAGHVFRRYRLEGASRETIAAELGICPNLVEMELSRAYVALVLARVVPA